jgi:hypothetical protein
MSMFKVFMGTGLAMLATLAAPVLAQDRIELKILKYHELGQLVKEARGKVVVVDLWALT